MKNSRKLLLALATCLTVLMMAGNALAAGYWYSYNLTVPRFGGSATTNNQYKRSFYEGRVKATSVGGGYTEYVRMELQNNVAVSNYYAIVSGTNRSIPNWIPGTQNVHMRFKSSSLTPVNVVSYGKWSPDNPAW